MTSQPNYITPQGFAALRAEYDHLFGVERPQIVEIVSWAAGNGDRSENGDYLYGRKRMREIDGQLRRLSKKMKDAKVIDPRQQPDKSKVFFGATVTIADEDDNQRSVTIVGNDEADAGKEKEGSFSYHHQPFAFFKRFQRGSPDRAKHLKDLDDFVADIGKGTLPQVAFYKPRRGINQHPSASDMLNSDAHTADLIERLDKSPLWPKLAVIVTYDENGGFWDHVAPPKRDRWGPGTRVPTIVVSPFAKKGFVDHTQYDTTSILKLIGSRFGTAPLAEADARADGMLNVFQF